jgi:hypothetical protein
MVEDDNKPLEMLCSIFLNNQKTEVLPEKHQLKTGKQGYKNPVAKPLFILRKTCSTTASPTNKTQLCKRQKKHLEKTIKSWKNLLFVKRRLPSQHIDLLKFLVLWMNNLF